jgi:hypothetical protein
MRSAENENYVIILKMTAAAYADAWKEMRSAETENYVMILKRTAAAYADTQSRIWRIQNSPAGDSQAMCPECITKYFTAYRCIIKSNPKLIFCAVSCNKPKHEDRLHNVTLQLSDLSTKTPFYISKNNKIYTENHMENAHKIKWEKYSIILY